MRLPRPSVKASVFCGPLVVALAAGVVILAAVNPAVEGIAAPGITVDESFNANEGVRLNAAVAGWLAGRYSTREVFGDPSDLRNQHAPLGYHLPDHPPLGRVWLGLFHNVSASWQPAENPKAPFEIARARTGSAVAFILLVLLIGTVTGRWYGPPSGFAAALAVALMPRVFGHAHLAALETAMCLSYAAVVFSVAGFWNRPAAPTVKTALWTGLVFGLALLTKIQAVLLPVPIGLWALLRWRQRAILPLCLWGLTGLGLFFLCWPWLWLDPVEHLREYFLRTTQRVTINVWYFGSKLADREVPWHYPAVMFLTCVPVGLQFLGFLGFGRVSRSSGDDSPAAWRDPRLQLILGCLLFPLFLFSLPGVVVYDGARLFLVSFPLWGIMIGRGTGVLFDWLSGKFRRTVAWTATGLLLLSQGYGLFAYAPCYLSYYNLGVGGLAGAERLGLEPIYWGDTLTAEFLREACQHLPQGAEVDVMPVPNSGFLTVLTSQHPILRERDIRLRGYHPESHPPKYVLIYRRKADLPYPLREGPDEARVLAELKRQGVRLAALYQFAE